MLNWFQGLYGDSVQKSFVVLGLLFYQLMKLIKEEVLAEIEAEK